MSTTWPVFKAFYQVHNFTPTYHRSFINSSSAPMLQQPFVPFLGLFILLYNCIIINCKYSSWKMLLSLIIFTVLPVEVDPYESFFWKFQVLSLRPIDLIHLIEIVHTTINTYIQDIHSNLRIRNPTQNIIIIINMFWTYVLPVWPFPVPFSSRDYKNT